MNTTFDPKTHIGTVDGVPWPSVTQLLKEFGIVDYSRVPDETLERKRLIGIRVHAATVLLDTQDLDEEDFQTRFPDCVGYLNAYRKFREIENFEPEHKERRYFSKKWRFHGAPDEAGLYLGKLGDEPVLIDYKCTWKMYESTGPQLAAYSMLLEECADIKIKKRLGLLLKPSGHYDIVPFKDPNDFQDFQACLWLHWQRRNKYKTRKGVEN